MVGDVPVTWAGIVTPGIAGSARLVLVHAPPVAVTTDGCRNHNSRTSFSTPASRQAKPVAMWAYSPSLTVVGDVLLTVVPGIVTPGMVELGTVVSGVVVPAITVPESLCPE